jgi:arylsulfatase A-like enzyme
MIWRMTSVALTLGLLLLSGLSACGSPAASGSDKIIVRLAPDDAGEPFDEESLLESREMFSWNLGEDQPQPWSVDAGGGRLQRRPNGLWVLDPDGPITLTRRVSFDAHQLHAVAVTFAGMGSGHIRLCWAGTGEMFSRCVAAKIPDRPLRRHTFKLAQNPLWSGEIERLQLWLDPRSSSRRVQVETVVALRYDVKEERLAAALGRSWQVTLEPASSYRDTRIALLAPPGLTTERRLQVPDNAFLRLSYGLQRRGHRGDVRFQVVVRRSAAESALLFERTLAPTPGSGAGWQEARIDLAEFAGETVDLVLTTESSEAIDLVRGGFPLWGHPEVVAPASADKPPNLVLVSVDTLRADHLSLYGYERDTSPNVDAWARTCATTFESVVAAAPWTIPSHASMMTGLDALSHGVNHETRIPSSLTTLAERLRDSGYATVAITGGGYLSAAYGFSQGFDRYLAWKQRSEAAKEPESGVDEALAWLEAQPMAPFFLFLHTYGTHTPYQPRQDYLSRFRDVPEGDSPQWIGSRLREGREEEGFALKLDWIWFDDPKLKRQGTLLAASELDWGRDLYDNEIANVDAQLGRLFAGLKRLGLDRDTLVILTSDHGESLGEKGLVGHTNLYDTNLLVPLVISRPACESGGRRVPSQVRSIDVVPTVLELLGVASQGPVDGVSLVPLMEGRPGNVPAEAWSYAGLANYGVSLRLGNRLKYIFNNTAWEAVYGEEELYRLTEDVAETRNLAIEDPRIDALRRRVGERLAGMAHGVQLRFGNETSEPFAGQIEPSGPGWNKRWTRVKSWNLPPRGLSATATGAFAFRVEPQESFDVILELTGAGGFLIKGALGSGPPFSAKLGLNGKRDSRQLRCTGGFWQEEELDETGDFTGIRVTWHDRTVPTEVDPVLTDPELLQQLRALGYVN